MPIYEACSHGTCPGTSAVVEELQAVENSSHEGRHPTYTPADGLPLQSNTQSASEINAPTWPQHLYLN
jgi:hypothetical protein